MQLKSSNTQHGVRNVNLPSTIELSTSLSLPYTLFMTTRPGFARRKLHQIGKYFDLDLINAKEPAELFAALLQYRDGSESDSPDSRFLSYVLRKFELSNAQLFQDLFVLFMTNEQQSGYFVEFGATDGVTLSNSYQLESRYGWAGILAEPARCWHQALIKNRRCSIETSCVWTQSGETLDFNEVVDGELSTINEYSDRDGHRKSRQHRSTYPVQTISLNDLLEKYDAPRQIDYLSIDTEGSEFAILGELDFSRRDIRIITVEHNFMPVREDIFRLLMTNGYRRIFPRFSGWDDWYVHESVMLEAAPNAMLDI